MDSVARIARKKSIRKKIRGTKEQPRLNVFRSNKHIYAALIDDSQGKTLVSISEKDLKTTGKETKEAKAALVGKKIAEEATKKGFKKIVFDRAGYIYHGRVKELAQAAREGGLKF